MINPQERIKGKEEEPSRRQREWDMQDEAGVQRASAFCLALVPAAFIGCPAVPLCWGLRPFPGSRTFRVNDSTVPGMLECWSPPVRYPGGGGSGKILKCVQQGRVL